MLRYLSGAEYIQTRSVPASRKLVSSADALRRLPDSPGTTDMNDFAGLDSTKGSLVGNGEVCCSLTRVVSSCSMRMVVNVFGDVVMKDSLMLVFWNTIDGVADLFMCGAV